MIADITMSFDGFVTGPGARPRLVDELGIHLAPRILDGGTSLFKPSTRQRYRQVDVRPSQHAVHLAYEPV